ncbi:MAG: biosynthetic-type acetolactate synthase large subunit [Candidatus Methylomirabilota bacterium]
MKKGKITGGKAIVKALEARGVELIFGYPGGANLPLYDEMIRGSFRQVLARHEQGAAHMADGYARVTGRVGVCTATSGPGATNLVTGIATAYMDSSAMVAITGQVSRRLIGNDAFQEVDTTGITIPITKHNYLVQSGDELSRTVAEAFYLAGSARPGPVLIDVPKDVLLEQCTPGDDLPPQLEGYRPTLKGHPGQIKRAAAVIKAAQRPVIIVGGGIRSQAAYEALLRLAEQNDIPVVSTLMGKGAFPNSHPLYLGLYGYHGRVAANTAITEADVVIGVATRFGDRSTGSILHFAPQAKLVHIDIDPAEVGKNIPALIPIVGDADHILGALVEQMQGGSHTPWVDRLRKKAAAHPLAELSGEVTIPKVLRSLKRLCPDPVLVTDVGRHQIFAAHYFPVDSCRSFLTSGGLGTMGFGLPAAIGAKLGRPDRPVVAICGDGGFLMTCQELVTAAVERVPVVALVMHDNCLGMIRQLQHAFYGKRFASCDLGDAVDFARLAESMGCVGISVTREAEIDPALQAALAAGRPCVVDCRIDAPANVYPMVTGATLMDYIE